MDEYRKRELEDADAMRDSQRKMAWYALFSMLLYPILIIACSIAGLTVAVTAFTDIAPTYFGAVSVLVTGFFVKDSIERKNKG